ncbi:MAG: methyltransferase domain-containing protein [Desulfobacteraceae bacterium]|nr:MAG: methyltransferase domain-containing protein [Desulfobacteraceae bacterium]
MDYNWIEIENIPPLTGEDAIILFGAGEGTRQLLHYFKHIGPQPRILAVADNDRSMWGRTFQDLPIIDPADIPNIIGQNALCRILVTTVSGRESVTAQLATLGLMEGSHFFNLGCYPSEAMTHLKTLLEFNDEHPFLMSESSILHVGPGGFLALECGLTVLGHTVYSLDAFGFAMHYPEVGADIKRYHAAERQFLVWAENRGYDVAALKSAWGKLFLKRGTRVYLNSKRIRYLFPYRFEQLPFQADSLDLVLSFNVLEHVSSPDQTVAEIWRVLKPGGFCFHRITTRDHRSFSAVAGYTPLSFLQYSPEQWRALVADKFHQNQMLPFQWQAAFKQHGFEIIVYKVLDRYDMPDPEYDTMHTSFKQFPREQLGEINCLQLLRKPNRRLTRKHHQFVVDKKK